MDYMNREYEPVERVWLSRRSATTRSDSREFPMGALPMLHSRYEIAIWGAFGFLRRFRAGRFAGWRSRGTRHSATARA